MSFFEELRRRNVVRMAMIYLVASWLILQISDVLFENLEVPGWAFRLVLGLLILGFPLALIFSWIFELTPEGLKLEKNVSHDESITHETGRKLNVAIAVLLVIAITGMIADRLIPESIPNGTGVTVAVEEGTDTVSDAPPPLVATDLSIAVLPFVNMSGDPDNEYFSDGLSEELLNTLVQIRELKVTGRTSSFAFKGQNLDLREVGEKLNVANVLEGSVRKADNRVRITAQLIKTDDGYHLWSETFDRELDDIFAIQAEIAGKVAKALSLTLLGEEEKTSGGTLNAEAYQAYLRGIHIFRRAPDDPETLETARGYFERAIELDPEYVAPWYGMSLYWERMNRNGIIALDASEVGMKEVAQQLNQIAPGSVEAVLSEGRNLLRHNRPRALELYRQALDLDPGSPDTNMLYGSVYFFSNMREEGLKMTRTALELDPLSLEALSRLAALESNQGQCDEVKRLRERALEIEPDYGRFNGRVGFCILIAGGDPAEALEWLEKEPLNWMRRTGKSIALHRLGRQEQAQQEFDFMVENYGDTAAYQFAQVNAQWGETNTALEWLQKALDVGDPGINFIGVDPFLDPVRNEPWFDELLEQAGMAGCCETAN